MNNLFFLVGLVLIGVVIGHIATAFDLDDILTRLKRIEEKIDNEKTHD